MWATEVGKLRRTYNNKICNALGPCIVDIDACIEQQKLFILTYQ